jgi:beta-glucosidase
MDYPKEIIESWKNEGTLKNELDFIKDGDLDIISTPTDFLGVNYYSRAINRCSKTHEDENSPVEIIAGEKTKFEWEVFPEGLKELLIRIKRDYSPASIFITENGASYDYDIEEAGHIDDVKRIDYISSHIEACSNAIKEGVPLNGYFCWSLMDNFEWAEGYYHKFGLIHVDNITQERIPKNSYKWYRNFLSG